MIFLVGPAGAITATPSSMTAIYQPLIVGLGAVVLGLLGNTLLEIFKHHQQDARLARRLRRALAAELRIELRTLKNGTEKLSRDEIKERPDDYLMQVPFAENFPIYTAYLKDLGVLSSKEVSLVVSAYSYIQARPEWLVSMAKLERVEGRLFAFVPKKHWEALNDMTRSALAPVEAAVDHLENGHRWFRRAPTQEAI